MNIAHVLHGILPFPCNGWGAVENIVANYKRCCERDGHSVSVINSPATAEAAEALHGLNPDVIHLHDERKVDLFEAVDAPVKLIHCHSPDMFNSGFASIKNIAEADCFVAAGSKRSMQLYQNAGVSPTRLIFAPIGVDPLSVNFTDRPKFPERCVCLARITSRKRQHLVQRLPFVEIFGPIDGDYTEFDASRPNYHGEMTREQLKHWLTDFGAMVLLSKSEAWTPLAVIEGLMAGLDVIISESCASNLHPGLPFVHILPKETINNPAALESTIRNVLARPKNRRAVRAYAEKHFNFDTLYGRYIHTLGKLVAEACKVR